MVRHKKVRLRRFVKLFVRFANRKGRTDPKPFQALYPLFLGLAVPVSRWQEWVSSARQVLAEQELVVSAYFRVVFVLF